MTSKKIRNILAPKPAQKVFRARELLMEFIVLFQLNQSVAKHALYAVSKVIVNNLVAATNNISGIGLEPTRRSFSARLLEEDSSHGTLAEYLALDSKSNFSHIRGYISLPKRFMYPFSLLNFEPSLLQESLKEFRLKANEFYLAGFLGVTRTGLFDIENKART